MKHLELFSGIGGFRRAMELLTEDKVMNFSSIGFSEIDTKAITTYRSNFHIDENKEIEIGDIVSFVDDEDNIDKLPNFDIVTGGFPCQAFSMMGSQDGFNDVRGTMFFYILKIISKKKPKYLLLENVKNLKTHDKGKTFARIKKELENIGYNIYYDIFNSESFHLPQKRNRLIIFATRETMDNDFNNLFNSINVSKFYDENYEKLSTFNYKDINDILTLNVPSKYYLSDKIKPTILADGSANFKAKSEINMKVARTLTATMHKMHRACQDNYYSQDFIDSLGSINPAKHMNKEQLARLSIRRLTPEEAFMLQGFPSYFATNSRNIGVSDGALYKQAGNAVSVNTIYAVLYFLIKHNAIKE